jgi:hydroxymethylbilane synthase
MSKIFRIGTRSSEMALRQSEEVIRCLLKEFPQYTFEMVTRPADADRDLKSRLSAMGGKGGAFISAMRSMMESGDADMAMHSLKDLPGNDEYYANTSYSIGACLPRGDPRDALIRKRGAIAAPDHAPSPAVIGTSSVRRTAFLRRLYPGSDIVPFRGAADTRVDRLDRGVPMEFNYGGRTPPLDALVLAKSGLERINLQDRISRVFSVSEMCPAVGQGIVVVEYARANERVRKLLAAIDDREARYCCEAERALLRTLNGHCDSPIGGYACIQDGRLKLKAVVISVDGANVIEVDDETHHADPAALGTRVGERLNELGAQTIIRESRYID